MHKDNTALMAAFKDLASACEPILKRGNNAERLAGVKDALSRVEECRSLSLIAEKLDCRAAWDCSCHIREEVGEKFCGVWGGGGWGKLRWWV